MSQELLINVAESEECRVAIVDKGSLEELYMERSSLASHVGNIYKGKVVNVEPAIQAAFVDFGIGRNGFLHVSDLHPRYFSAEDSAEKIGKRKSVTQRPPIQKCLKKGLQVVVQVTKEGVNTKGPTLSTYISLPGKYIVLMPWMQRFGVSQKIEDEEARKKLRQMVEEFSLPKDAGMIIRTAAQLATKKELHNDIAYLTRLWNAIRKRLDKENPPCEVYQESDLVIRTIRDVFDTKIGRIVCDSETVTKRIRDFLGIVQPRLRRRAVFYDGKTPLFHKYGIEKEIAKIQASRVELKSGGSVIIEPTEALVSIDVNSGKYRRQHSAEQTALKINIEAAGEIARQLRLRDLGGLIICDFIDMRETKNKRTVERAFRDAIRTDRARSKVLRMSAFGLIELTRQRMRPSLQSSTYLKCPRCNGTGIIKSFESQSIEIIRQLYAAVAVSEVAKIEIIVSPEVAGFLQNYKRAVIARLEADASAQILIVADQNCTAENYTINCFDERGSRVKF